MPSHLLKISKSEKLVTEIKYWGELGLLAIVGIGICFFGWYKTEGLIAKIWFTGIGGLILGIVIVRGNLPIGYPSRIYIRIKANEVIARNVTFGDEFRDFKANGIENINDETKLTDFFQQVLEGLKGKRILGKATIIVHLLNKSVPLSKKEAFDLRRIINKSSGVESDVFIWGGEELTDNQILKGNIVEEKWISDKPSWIKA